LRRLLLDEALQLGLRARVVRDFVAAPIVEAVREIDDFSCGLEGGRREMDSDRAADVSFVKVILS
jgi:hypothetical protein